MNYSREYLKTNSIIESWPLKEEEEQQQQRRLLPSLSPETVSNATFCTFPVGKGFCHRLPSDGWRCSAHHHVIGHSDDNDDEFNETEPVSWAWSNGDDTFIDLSSRRVYRRRRQSRRWETLGRLNVYNDDVWLD